jgi:hypothetical protein
MSVTYQNSIFYIVITEGTQILFGIAMFCDYYLIFQLVAFDIDSYVKQNC